MFELTINGEIYQFKFGMGFLREIDKQISVPVDGMPNVKKNVGLSYMIARILNGEVDALIDVLDIANKGMEPRITKKTLDIFVEDESTDIDDLFNEVIDFLSKANATKKTMKMLQGAANQVKAAE